MKQLEITQQVGWENVSFLTKEQKPKSQNFIITGYSKEPFEVGDTITELRKYHYTVVKELERRDAGGVWNNKETPKNKWFKIEASLQIISN